MTNYRLLPFELRRLCIENNWFTAGSNYQYGKLFEMNGDGASIEDLALIIWVCSTNVDLNEIAKKLYEELMNEKEN